MGQGLRRATTGTPVVDKLDSDKALPSVWMPSTQQSDFLRRKTRSCKTWPLSDLKRKIEVASGIEPGRQKLTLRETTLGNDTAPLMVDGIAPGVRFMLTKSFPVATIKDPSKVKSLFHASDLEGLREAALQGYDLDVKSCSHYDLLHNAAMTGDLEMVQLILETGVSVFSLTRHYPKTALQLAAKYNQMHVCEFLVASGLDPHEKGKMTSDDSGRRIQKWDAVEYASRHGHGELADWLRKQPSFGRRHSEL